jgi:ABC-2 type transport system permease protein
MMSASRVSPPTSATSVYELTKMARTPAFAIPTIIFPAMFYLLFGIHGGCGRGNAPVRAAGAGTLERVRRHGAGPVRLRRVAGVRARARSAHPQQALPMPPGSYLIGRMFNAMVFVCISTLLLLTIAVTMGHVPVTLGQAARILFVDALGVCRSAPSACSLDR